MARHATFTLDSETALHASKIRKELLQANGDGIGVRIVVAKRDTGEVSTREGIIVGWSGIPGMSNDSVTVETDKGPRTFNVWLIRSVEIVGM